MYRIIVAPVNLLKTVRARSLRFYWIAPYNAYNSFVVESVLLAWINHLRQVCQHDLEMKLLQIEFPEPIYAFVFAKFLKCQIEFNAKHNRIRLSQKSLALSNPQYCASTWHSLLLLYEEQLVLKLAATV